MRERSSLSSAGLPGLQPPTTPHWLSSEIMCQAPMSQLYQLRGRVGRSERQAYAYLFYPKERNIPEIAEKRLAAIEEFTELGAGFKVAMRDLGPGGYVVLPPGMQHFAKIKTDAIVQIDSEGPFQINYVNPADDPRSAK